MSPEDYQTLTRKTAVYPDACTGEPTEINYLLFGLMSEVGEVADKWKKEIRDGKMFTREDWCKELGDCQYYLARLADAVDLQLSYVMEKNIQKLASRQERGVIGGSGDNR